MDSEFGGADASFLSIGTIIAPEDDENVNVILMEPDVDLHDHEDTGSKSGDEEDDSRLNVSVTVSTSYVLSTSATSTSSFAGRDPSHAGRDASADNTRQTCNTQRSILDLTRDEDTEDDADDDEDDGSVLFQDLRDANPTRLHEDAQDHTTTATPNTPKTTATATSEDNFKSLETPQRKRRPRNTPASASRSASRRHRRVNSKTPTRVLRLKDEDEKESESFETKKGSGLLGQLSISPDTFFDSICTSPYSNSAHKSSSCAPTNPLGCSVGATDVVDEEEDEATQALSTLEKQTVQLESDVWMLLGCSDGPTSLEMASIWNPRRGGILHKKRTSRRPLRASLKHRMQKIHRLRQAQRCLGETRHGMTFSNKADFPSFWNQRAVSMDQDDWRPRNSNLPAHQPHRNSLINLMGVGFPTVPQTRPTYQKNLESEGYDSDPELIAATPDTSLEIENDASRNNKDWDSRDTQAMGQIESAPRTQADDSYHSNGSYSSDEEDVQEAEDQSIYQAVQQTLNSTWTLTWHPNPKNVKEYKLPDHKPLCINIWMERGTVVTQTGVVVEPNFMWRDAYQPTLNARKLNATSRKPWSMRLLNTCRIARCTGRLDKSIYPLVRPSHSLILKTCNGQEFVLEANSESEIDFLCERWKLAVARFASLAVIEDVDAIAEEFFHPTLCSQTLTLGAGTPEPSERSDYTDASLASAERSRRSHEIPVVGN